MSKLVYTQSFSNLIEETYRLGLHLSNNSTQPSSLNEPESYKSQIGFFKVNLEVLIEHGLKRLKKE